MDKKFYNTVIDAFEPEALDLMEKGDDFEKEPVNVKVNRCTNKGRRQRRRNEALKKAEILCRSDRCWRGPYVCDKGYIKRPHSSDTKNFLKKESNRRCRALNRRIDEDDAADIQNRKRFDLWWELD